MSEQITNNPSVPSQVVAEVTFPKFINNLGIIPTSYKDSMSYYECLAWLCKYLEETVIPTVNQNGNAVQELQNLYIELNSYVTNYFENLDVQEEINNKLDEMSKNGELQNIVDTYFTNITQTINNQFELQNNKINALESGSPLVASSTSEMTDTTRVYVNTTDGKWYYYDGDSWEIGGTYQSSGIANNSINYLQLDNDLQSNFFDNYSEPLELGDAYVGFYKNNGTLNQSEDYKNYHYALTSGKTYLFTGKNISQLNALVIMDNSNNVIYASNPNNTTGMINYKFKCLENNLTAYISMPVSQTENLMETKINGILRELTSLYNQLKYSENIPEILEFEDSFILAPYAGTGSIRLADYEGYTTKVYQATKGRKYKITGNNISAVAGCVLSNLNNEILYTSSTENIGGTPVAFEKIYTFTSDGFINISQGEITDINIELLHEGIDITYINDKIEGKKLGCDGDSIMKGSGNSNVSYADMIAENNNMDLQKLAVGGGTIATGTYNEGNPRHYISTSVLDLDNDCDIILINGGVNDYGCAVPLGTLTDTFTSTVDSSTFYGGLETLCRNLLTKFSGKQKIFYVIDHHINELYHNTNAIDLTLENYIECIENAMNKYGIEIIDIGKNTHFNTGLTTFKNTYTSSNDGVHPNTNGYKYFYVDYITNKINY